ncbi:GGDEF domain-containing protein [Rhabdothermincola sp.]|uniref:GGDEF domain-containing protein n=1 Tax=Rhabdothermincola sp. TaxID=2820405 RepID=UPI002FE40464
MNRRPFAVLAVGAIGLVVGVAAAVWDAVALAVVAGSLALVAGVAGYRLVGLLYRARKEIDELQEKVQQLEQTVDHEARARAEVEKKLASRIELTAMRKSTQGDALTDEPSGLFSEGYFTVALDARIAAARRNLRPVAVALIEVIEGLDSGLPRPAEPATVAQTIRETIREADTACRLLDGGYALVLEDTTENGAIWTVERIRRRLVTRSSGLTMWAGVACYPAHGLSTEEVLDRADLALDMAREWRQDRIEVASADS